MKRRHAVLGGLALLFAAVSCAQLLGLDDPKDAPTSDGGAMPDGGTSEPHQDGATDGGPAGDAADASARCSVSSPDQCSRDGIQRCSDAGVWETTTCPPHKSCVVDDAGAPSCECTPNPCRDKNDGKFCLNGGTMQTCATDTNGCGYVASTENCSAATPICDEKGGSGSAVCTDMCPPIPNCGTSDTRCLSSTKMQTCAPDNRGCLNFGAEENCPLHQTCTGEAPTGRCRCETTVCTSAAGTCSGVATTIACAQDANGCFYPTGVTTTCSAGTECKTGTCQTCSATATPLAVWSSPAPASSPPARASAAMTYDAVNQRVVMFGGVAGSTRYNDTWLWDGTTWLGPYTSNPPTTRYDVALAYHNARSEVVLFGGDTSAGVLDDTHVWNGTSWTRKCGAGSCGPQARSAHAMAYDSDRQRIVMFGGTTGAAHPNPGWALSETWEWDGTSWTATCGGPNPKACAIEPLIRASMAYDPIRKRVVLYGGFGYSSPINKVWEYDGTIWSPRNDVTSVPPPRGLASLSYDAQRSVLVLYGGHNAGVWKTDTWEFDGNCWKNATGGGSPSERRYQSAAYDSVRLQLVLFGGYDSTVAVTNTTFLK